MNLIQLSSLLLVPMFSAQASAQVETPTATIDSLETVPEETLQETYDKDSDDVLQVRVKGFLDTYHALRTTGNADWMASRTRARGEVRLEKGATALFVSLNAIYNGILKERTGIELREAYLSYTKGNLDLRVGRQIVIWGVADALRLTDCVSPIDYTEFLAQDYDDIRMPVNGLRAKYTLGAITAEAVCNPVTNFAVIPTDLRNPWAMRLPNTSPPLFHRLGKRKTRKATEEHGIRWTHLR